MNEYFVNITQQWMRVWDLLPGVAVVQYGAAGRVKSVSALTGAHVDGHTLTLSVLRQSVGTLTARNTDPAALVRLTAPAIPQISTGRPAQTPTLLIHLPSRALHRWTHTTQHIQIIINNNYNFFSLIIIHIYGSVLLIHMFNK